MLLTKSGGKSVCGLPLAREKQTVFGRDSSGGNWSPSNAGQEKLLYQGICSAVVVVTDGFRRDRCLQQTDGDR